MRKFLKGIGLVFVSLIFNQSIFAVDATTGASKIVSSYDQAKLALVASQFRSSESTAKLAYQKEIKRVLNSKNPILPLANLSDPKKKQAQQIMLANPQVQRSAFERNSGAPLRTEVMTIEQALPGDLTGFENMCANSDCYRVNMYNFFFNATVAGLVNITSKRVIGLNTIFESQPELSKRLKDLAVSIAKNEPAAQLEIKRYLDFIGESEKTNAIKAVMVDTKSALKDTLCERSKHLCVSPTYVLGDKAMWVIVDLTDMKVVGIRWTNVGSAGPPTLMTERTLENEYVFKNYCENVNTLNRNGWRFDYHITTSDGLRLAQIAFNNKPILSSVKVVDWHVSYSLDQRFGYGDATGCPMFSSAVVVAYDGPKITPILEDGEEIGFSITQDFRQLPWPAPCNYRYEERYEFYNDGRYRIALSNHGRGCGEGGVYRPIVRMELPTSTTHSNHQIQQWHDGQWQTLSRESWSLQQESQFMHKAKYSHRIVNKDGSGYLMEPSVGQFGDNSRGDNAYVYTTINHPDKDEGKTDMVTLGSCCNANYQQGPEQFLEPAEAITDQPLVLWYVPQMENDGQEGQRYCWAETQVVDGVAKPMTWPCTAGPMFVPINTAND